MQNNTAEDYEYAGFGVRLLASLIDTLLLATVTYPVLFMIYGADYFTNSDSSGFFDIVLTYIFPFIAVILFWVSKRATPGKLALDLQVVDADTGDSLSIEQSIIRYVGYIVSAIVLCLGFVWIAFDSRKQGWHDKLSNTVVIRSKNHGPEPVSFKEPHF